ncbi:hypothetical protein AKJ09_03035 [Labilithrix luteola]|uniref:Uncharacterized protein n=1 Tax=Labilithrix luteola TaxID=1391654 RepID=A0A0K1PSM8_9BACT|nr:hypothetical protein AKJ09_03035 [Labilithrix luteola]
MWLTAIGAVLFFLVGLWWALCSSGPSTAPQENAQNVMPGSALTAPAQAQAAPGAPPVQSARPLNAPGARPGMPAGLPSGLPPGFKHP